MSGCVFCAILEGRAPGAIVYRGADGVAFLDVKPLFPGHVLVVPERHVETLGDLPAEGVAPLFGLVRKVARAVERELGVDGTFVAQNNRVSQSVPHLHVHVVPRRKGDGLRGFFWPRTPYADDEAKEAMRARLDRAIAEE